ncbi:hypothetical protein [Teredinibacter sp. KSP-S5-2]|uniref:hypothetical protein n=1 Tax=Teredinibacter sp. KSP-S5-2 TaxID=3034506 RepID=UPI002934B8F1|nr:hypothetical protein [Teredinibacter sp. KSP-S5-2]WNO08960.1 hypothetical protein P5V12_18600 [Teredinibacter sp. KSP-S5-2]
MKQVIKSALIAPLAASCLVGLTACNNDTNSHDVDTRWIRAEITLTSPGDGKTYFEAYLKDNNLYLELADFDNFEAEMNGQEKELKETRDEDGNFIYKNHFDSDESGTNVRVSLYRYIEDDAHSYVDLPEPANFVLPTNGQAFAEDEAIDITWSTAGISSYVTLKYTPDCSGNTQSSTEYSSILQDNGAYSTTVADLLQNARDGITADQDCTIKLTLSRMEDGDPSREFESGFIRAYQDRTITINVPRP